MGKRIVPVVIVAAILAFAAAAMAVAFVPDRPRLWSSAVALVVLGGITPLIYAVNIRIVPVFSMRTWQQPVLMYAAMVFAITGGWLVFLGRAIPAGIMETAGTLAALAGGVLFVVSVVRLFRSAPTSKVRPPLPYPGQAEVDRIGTQFMRLAGIYLLLGLGVGVMLRFWTPATGGRWDLVWAHLLLVGWFLSMASGVLYHVLTRWTTGKWRHPQLIRAHLLVSMVGLPLMVVALAFNMTRLFAIAGPLQAIALLFLVWNVVPLARKLPWMSRVAVIGAGVYLALGVSLGASAAMDPANHATLRLAHAQINLFGWGGLLICGVGYYLFPRFAGQPLRWPRLAAAQGLLLLASVIVSATAWWRYFDGNRGIEPLLTISGLLIAASFLTFALITALTFRKSAQAATTTALPQLRMATRR